MNSRAAFISIVAIFCCLSLALIFFGAYPAWKDIQKTSNAILNDKSLAAFTDLQNKEVDAFKAHYDEYKPNLEKLQRFIVDSKNPVNFIKFLEETAFSNTMTVDISLQNTKENQKGNIQLQIAAKGTFANMASFTKQIESGPYLISVHKLSLAPAKEAAKGVLEGIFSIQVLSK